MDSVTLDDLQILKSGSDDFASLSGDYITASFSSRLMTEIDRKPVRLAGLTILLNLSGEVCLDINTHRVTVGENQLVVFSPDSLAFCIAEDCHDCRSLLLSISPVFLQSVSLDLSVVMKSYHKASPVPVLSLDPVPIKMLRRYIEMLRLTAETAETGTAGILTRNIARSLTAALIYYLMQLVASNFEKMQVEVSESSSSRRVAYLRDFLKLLRENFRQERSVGFYATKLFISPKYLSALIKEETGRSAAEWIDQFVILEAKNLLRFSGMNVQQVAYTLNFNNQSAFGKYFKHLVGVSPSEFQKG